VHGYDNLITAVEPVMAAKRGKQAGRMQHPGAGNFREAVVP
jgi:hypothetical protein